MNTSTTKLKPCPFCGYKVDGDDEDTLYPSGIYWADIPGEDGLREYFGIREVSRGKVPDGRVWLIHCPIIYGGCGAEMKGDSEEETIEKWNRRVDNNS